SFAPPATAEQGKNQTVPTRVYFVKVKTGPATKTATGVFVQYQPPTPPDQPLGLLTLRDAWGGDVCQYPVAPKVWLKINEITRPLADLPPGSLVTATLHGDEITHLAATLAPAEPGAIPPGSLVRQGRLRSIGAGRVTLVAADGREVRYALSPAVAVIAGNQLATLDDLQPGDPVTLRLGDYLGTTVERIEIPRLNRTVAGVYKGVVEFINPVTRQAALRQATKLAGAAWTPLTGKISVRLPDTNLFVNGQAVSPETFTRYGRGKTILFSAATDFGAAPGTRFNATRLTVLNGLGQPFNDRIAAIDPGGKVLTTGISGSSVVLDQTTIILRNGRLADARDLTAGDPVTLYADAGATGYRAALLVVDKERVPAVAPDDGLIQGWIRWFNADGEITAGPYSRLREHTWETFGTGQDTTTFNPAPDTLVFDQRQGTTATVPVEDFLTLGVNSDYDDCYFLAYLRQGRPVVITLQSPGPLGESRPPEQTTLARLESRNPATGTGRFTAVEDWSDHSRRWVPGTSDLTLDLTSAFVLKNGRVIAKEQLKPGDQCQITRRWDPDRAKNIASFIFLLD
ncbi:MAG: hypothetical protein PHU78_10645, partial [Heliobacteriaceae bacterium]|nr:hypothetical protein [Heliobacteriaceae bacterium]